MSKSNSMEQQILAKIFNATALPWDGVTILYVSLHTGDPGEAGVQASGEATYTGYARVGVARTTAGWVVSAAGDPTSVSPAANIDFPVCTAGANTITHVGIGTAASGAGSLLYSGTVTPAIAVSAGVIPRLTTASTITED